MLFNLILTMQKKKQTIRNFDTAMVSNYFNSINKELEKLKINKPIKQCDI